MSLPLAEGRGAISRRPFPSLMCSGPSPHGRDGDEGVVLDRFQDAVLLGARRVAGEAEARHARRREVGLLQLQHRVKPKE